MGRRDWRQGRNLLDGYGARICSSHRSWCITMKSEQGGYDEVLNAMALRESSIAVHLRRCLRFFHGHCSQFRSPDTTPPLPVTLPQQTLPKIAITRLRKAFEFQDLNLANLHLSSLPYPIA